MLYMARSQYRSYQKVIGVFEWWQAPLECEPTHPRLFRVIYFAVRTKSTLHARAQAGQLLVALRWTLDAGGPT